ncbi:MAG: R2-like ligand-binding oxidase [Rhodothermaceae bacterium]|nr:R2-like ligand-binding oxidase [Rhodothermaceae bacterium]
MELHRISFKTTRHGLDYGLAPMRLFKKAKALGIWDPAAVDLMQDAADWQTLTADEQDLLLRLTAQFGAGEESVTADLLPLLGVMADAGWVEDELFLTSYLWEEAKHVEAFDRFLREVAQSDADLDGYLTEAYRQHFMAVQPAAMNRLRTDRSPEALAEAAVTYQMGTEGVLAETGYHAYYTVLEARGIMPGMQQLVRSIQRDESRHVGYGVYLLSRLVAEHGDDLWAVIEARMNTVLMTAMQVVQEMLAPYGDAIPFEVSLEQFLDYAQRQFMKRYTRIERARGQSLDAILYGVGVEPDEPGGDGAA